MKVKLTIWMVLAFLGLGTHELISVWIRPHYGVGEGLIPFLLGVLPNFLAAGLIFPFGLLTIRESYTSDRQKTDKRNLDQWFGIGLVGSQVGLIMWEFMQLEGNLIFDGNDILATLLGGGFAFFLYNLFKENYLRKWA